MEFRGILAAFALVLGGADALAQPSFTIDQSVSPTPPIGGECPFSWDITVTNNGPTDATSVWVCDTIQAQVYLGCSGGLSCGRDIVMGNPIAWWDVGPLAAGSSATVHLLVAAYYTCSSFEPMVIFDDGTGPPNGYAGALSGGAEVVNPVPSTFDATINKAFPPDMYVSGEPVKFQVTYNLSGAGTDTAANFRIWDTIPAGANVLRMDPAPGGTVWTVGNLVIWNMGDIPIASTENTVTLWVAAPNVCSAAIVNSDFSYASENRCGKTVISGPLQLKSKQYAVTNAGITINKSIDRTVAPQGGMVTYTIDITNPCESSALNITVWDSLPAGTVPCASTFDSASNSGTVWGDSVNGYMVAWSLDALYHVGSGWTPTTATMDFTVSVSGSGPTVGPNRAYADFTNKGGYWQSRASSGPRTFTVMNPFLQFSMTGPSSVAGGESATFTLTVKNVGTDTAFGVRIVDTIPAYFYAVDPVVSGSVVSWDIGTLDIGASVTVTLTIKSVRQEANRTVTMQASASSLNGNGIAMATVKDSDTVVLEMKLAEPKVYPTPFNPAKAVGGVLKFTELPDGSTVTIYTLTGAEVIKLSGVKNHWLVWPGINKEKEQVAAGMYLYMIEMPASGGGKKKIEGRFGLVR